MTERSNGAAEAEQDEVVHNEAEQRFELAVEGGLAQLGYQRRDGAPVLSHTEVPPASEGEGVGSRLVLAALEHFEAAGERIVPSCPFVHDYIERHPVWRRIVAGG